MERPAISVLLPVYNAGLYLKEAIDSILCQTFVDFELVIIDDGSTDNSAAIIQSYIDPRIRYYKNDKNEGLIYTLNKGLDLCKGNYIARMDADDISLPQRLEKQFDWIERKFPAMVVGCHVSFIDEKGDFTGEWKEDMNAITPQQVRKGMIKENCMAHPSIIARNEAIRWYRYKENQKNTEDYDLWLRLLADGHRIEKVPEKLLLYRVLSTSVTGQYLRKRNPFLVIYNCKRKFIAGRIKQRRWSSFETAIVFSAMKNLQMAFGKRIKSIIRK